MSITSHKYHVTGEYFWHMTQKRYGDIVLHAFNCAAGMIPHIEYVKQALLENKPVPTEVLMDYPNLQYTI